jgi:hypothetical protein
MVCRCRLGSERHQVCLLDARGTTVGEREFPHSGEGLAELGDWLLSMASAASTVAVAIEVPHGPVVDALIDRGFVVYAINPKQLDAYATGSVSRVPRTITATPMCRPTAYARTGVCSAAFRLLIHGSSNCVRGRALERNSGWNGFG